MISSMVAILLFLVAGLISLACFAFWIWMLVHAIRNKRLEDIEKIVWVLVLIFVPFIGAIIYFFIGRPERAGGIS